MFRFSTIKAGFLDFLINTFIRKECGMTETLKSLWIIKETAVMPDRRNGGTMVRVTFVNLKTQVTADTYICPSNRNARNWTEVLQNIREGMLLGNLKLIKKKNKFLISADSKPEIKWIGSKEKLQSALDQLWKPKNNFEEIFKIN